MDVINSERYSIVDPTPGVLASSSARKVLAENILVSVAQAIRGDHTDTRCDYFMKVR